MSYFVDGNSSLLPAHIVPDDGVTLLPGVANLNRLPNPENSPKLRWRIGNNSDPDGTIWFKDYDNPGSPEGMGPPGGVGGFNAQIWVNVLNDYSTTVTDNWWTTSHSQTGTEHVSLNQAGTLLLYSQRMPHGAGDFLFEDLLLPVPTFDGPVYMGSMAQYGIVIEAPLGHADPADVAMFDGGATAYPSDWSGGIFNSIFAGLEAQGFSPMVGSWSNYGWAGGHLTDDPTKDRWIMYLVTTQQPDATWPDYTKSNVTGWSDPEWRLTHSADGAPYIAWGMDGFDEAGGNNWYWHPDTGWVMDNTSPVPIETRTVDRYDSIPPGWAWSAVNGLKPGAPPPTVEWPYQPSAITAGEGGWGVVRLGR